MSTYFLLSFGLISFLLFACFISSSSSIFLPNNDRSSSTINNHNEEKIRILPSKDLFYDRDQRSPAYYPRANRNTWFRVQTYQHFKPSDSEETPSGDPLMRWG
jgi:hypothetical protein